MSRTFYIIDGHAQIFRAYYAPFRELTSPAGEPTKATFVFTQMLMNLAAQRKPDYLAMVIDSPEGKLLRKKIYPQYKSNRQQQPDEFRIQERRILQIIQDAGVHIFQAPEAEADDVIATMARLLHGQGYDIVLVSKDKDLRQLINDCTRMYDVQSDTFTDAAKMEADCGYTPAQAVEVQTLMGDAIDCVPGIPGVGEKRAAELIRKYGKADEVLNHLDELTPKMRENFQQNAGQLAMARTLVTLKSDVPLAFDPESCAFRGFNIPGLKKHLEALDFTSLLKRLGDQSPAPPAVPSPQPLAFSEGLFGPLPHEKPQDTPPADSGACDYQLVDTQEKFDAFLNQLKRQKHFAFDTETDGLGAMQYNLIGMSFSWKDGSGYYIPVRGPAGCQFLNCEQVLPKLRPFLEDPAIGKIGHNIKYDILVMRQAGIHVRGVEMDTMIAAFVLDASRMQYGIDALARDLLNFRKIATIELIGKGRSQVPMDRVALDRVARYASEDADIAWRLSNLLRAKLKELPALAKLNDELETPLIDVLVEMEHNGVAIDQPILKEQSRVLGDRAAALKQQIMEAAGCEFNPDSPKQLADVLFTKLGLRSFKRTKTGQSTDVEVLEKLAAEHQVPRLILEYRSLVKLKNTYLDNLSEFVNAKTNRIHASFNQIGAETGRLSCSDPNLQNIPIRTDEGRRIRMAFVPGDRERDVLLTADYSQIELRMLAHFTHEPALVKAFEADEDVHATVAAEVFAVPLDKVSKAQRGQAKIINFGIIYGVSAYGLARRIDGLSVQAAEDLIIAYKKRFPGIDQFMQKCVMEANSQGYVETILGRRRRIPQLSSPVLAQRNAGERMAINSVIQGSAADLIKVAMLHVHRRLKDESRPSRMLMQVHDELVFEVPKSAAEDEAAMIRREMLGAMNLAVPLKVDIGWGGNWEEGK
jgi:DNA polymerase-1